MSTAGERESYEALRSSYIHLLSFLIPQRYIWVKKKALSGNVIKLSKSAHTKKAHLDFSRWAFFMLSLCGLLVLTSRTGQ